MHARTPRNAIHAPVPRAAHPAALLSGAPPCVPVVVVHYGDHALLARCLESVRASARVRAPVVVVDNSAARSGELVRRVEDGGGAYLHHPENPGFAAGANGGLRCARVRYESDVLVLLNSDLRLGRHCLRLLSESLLHHREVGVVGPALLEASRPRHYWNVGSTVSWPCGKPRSHGHGAPYRSGQLQPRDVDYICGAALAVRPQVLEQVGFLSEEYYLYYEDADFSFRVRASGYRVLVLPAARAWHHGGGAFEGLGIRALYYRTRNRLVFSAGWNPSAVRGCWSRGVFAARAFLRGAGRLVAGRRREAAALWRAVRDYYGGARGKAELNDE